MLVSLGTVRDKQSAAAWPPCCCVVFTLYSFCSLCLRPLPGRQLLSMTQLCSSSTNLRPQPALSRESFLCPALTTITSPTQTAPRDLLPENPTVWCGQTLPPQGEEFDLQVHLQLKIPLNSDSSLFSLSKRQAATIGGTPFPYFQHNHSYWWNWDHASFPKFLWVMSMSHCTFAYRHIKASFLVSWLMDWDLLPD